MKHKQIIVTINFEPLKRIDGDCDHLKTQGGKYTNHYHIRIDSKLKRHGTYETLAHELLHTINDIMLGTKIEDEEMVDNTARNITKDFFKLLKLKGGK